MSGFPQRKLRLTNVDGLTQDHVASVHGQSQMLPLPLPHATALPRSVPCVTLSSLKDTCPHVHPSQVLSWEDMCRTPMAEGTVGEAVCL